MTLSNWFRSDFEDESTTVVWLGQRQTDAIMPAKSVSQLGIASLEGVHPVSVAIGDKTTALEHDNGHRLSWTSVALQSNVFKMAASLLVRDMLGTGACRTVIIPYAPIGDLPNIPDEVSMVSPQPQVAAMWANKAFARVLLADGDVRIVPGMLVSSKNLETALDGRDSHGQRFVIQLLCGSSGNGTYLSHSDWKRDRANGVESADGNFVLVSSFIDGPVLNAHCSVDRVGNVRIWPPSLQVIDLDRDVLGQAGVYCGNDFARTAEIDHRAMEDICKQLLSVARIMSSTGYYGVFGVDFILDHHKAYIMEVNPRFQGSSALLQELNVLQGYSNIFLGQLDCCLGELRYPLEVRPYSGDLMGFSQVVVHHIGCKSIVGGRLLPGVYTMDDSRLTRRRPDTSIADLRAGEFRISSDVVHEGLQVSQGAALCRIVCKDTVLCDDLVSPSSRIKKVVDAVRRDLGLASLAEKGDLCRQV